MRCQQRKQSKLWLLSDGDRNRARRVGPAGMMPVAMGIRHHPQVSSESAGPAQGPGDWQREAHVRMEDPCLGTPPKARVLPRHGSGAQTRRGTRARCGWAAACGIARSAMRRRASGGAAPAAARWVVPTRVHRGEVERRVRCGTRARGCTRARGDRRCKEHGPCSIFAKKRLGSPGRTGLCETRWRTVVHKPVFDGTLRSGSRAGTGKARGRE